MDDLVVAKDLAIPGNELVWRFSTTGGPGGQHANRSATRATLRWSPTASVALSDEQRRRILEKLAARLVGDAVEVSIDESRSQWRNRQRARARLAELLREALRPDPPPRRPTRPSRAVRRSRLETKRRRGETKRLRRPPDDE